MNDSWQQNPALRHYFSSQSLHTYRCKSPQCKQKVIYSVKPKKQRWEPETTEPDTFHPLAAPRNKKAQNRLFFIEFSLPFLIGDKQKAWLNLKPYCWQWKSSSYYGFTGTKNSPDTQYHHKHPPQDTPVHITHVDWLSNLPYTLKYHDQDENHIICPESKIHLMVELSSEVCWQAE